MIKKKAGLYLIYCTALQLAGKDEVSISNTYYGLYRNFSTGLYCFLTYLYTLLFLCSIVVLKSKLLRYSFIVTDIVSLYLLILLKDKAFWKTYDNMFLGFCRPL
jgi:hypothetical protein